MKTQYRAAAVLVVLACVPCFCLAAGKDYQSKVALGGRMYGKNTAFSELLHGEGDISYGAAYEYHERFAYWQVALQYSPDPTKVVENEDGTELQADSIYTPEINLIAKDEGRIWRGGIGILRSYQTGEGLDDWTDFYWQFIFGIQIPVARVDAGLYANYVFKDWGKFYDFDADAIDFSLWLSLSF